jgi:hypothetical protein
MSHSHHNCGNCSASFSVFTSMKRHVYRVTTTTNVYKENCMTEKTHQTKHRTKQTQLNWLCAGALLGAAGALAAQTTSAPPNDYLVGITYPLGQRTEVSQGRASMPIWSGTQKLIPSGVQTHSGKHTALDLAAERWRCFVLSVGLSASTAIVVFE